MATVTSPIITDTTGQDIVDGLTALANAVKPNASDIPYSNASSGLSSNDVQGAIDEVSGNTFTQLGETFTDCNAVFDVGMYNANMGTVSNAPTGTMVSSNGGQLIVIHRASDVRVFQILFVYVGNGNRTEIYARAQKNATSFADWERIDLNIHTETFTGTTNSQGLLTTNIPWTGQILAAYATVVSTSVRVFAIGHRPSGGNYIVSKLMTDSGGVVSEQQVTLTITLIG